MACKKPIFMVIDGVSRELVELAGCGVYVEPENPQDFKSKIENYLKHSEKELQEIGVSGYHYAKQHFGRDNLASKYIQNIKSTIS